MALPNFDNEVPPVSARTASEYVHVLVGLERAKGSTNEIAFEKLARDYGLTPSQLIHLYKRKAKTCDVGLFARIKGAYLDRCAKMIADLQHDLAIQGVIDGNVDDQDLVLRAADLAAEVAAKRTALNTGREVK